MTDINLLAFYKSIDAEITDVKNRVRNLIGDRHWGKEGEYKEAILRNVIRRFLPKNYSIGTGFVFADYFGKTYMTSQIDIIIYDNTHPILFHEGDFVIVTPQSVHAIIEVKTQLKVGQFEKIVGKINDDARLIRQHQGMEHEFMDTENQYGSPSVSLEEKPQELFVGLFSYGTSKKESIFFEKLKRLCLEQGTAPPLERYFVNNIVLARDCYIEFKKMAQNDRKLTLFKMENLSYAKFIINLMWKLNFMSVYMGSGVWSPFDEADFVISRVAV